MTHVVGLDEVAGEDLAGTDTTVVGTLGRGVAALGPLERPAVRVEERVLLLKTEPGDVLQDAWKKKASVTVARRKGTEDDTSDSQP